jgi:RNA polymerase sigma-70 factor (ECF subfamily)
MQYSDAIAAVAAGRRWSAGKEISDQALAGLIAQGDKVAMQVLFARHNVRVFRFLMRFVDGEATAEDLVSEVFIEVWRNAAKFGARSQVSTWLLGIARHKALSALRRRSTDELDDDVIEFIEDPSDNPEVTLQKTERSEILRDCLKQLSPSHREIIDLVYYHERTIDDVAEIIGVPQNTVKTRMFYARKRIGELLAARGLDRTLRLIASPQLINFEAVHHLSSPSIDSNDKYRLSCWMSGSYLLARSNSQLKERAMAYVASLFHPGKARIITSRVIQGILAAAFVAAATAKLMGVPMMIQVFDAIGLGQWFRIVTALVEIGGAAALLIPGFAAFGALWLAVTMFFATLTHLFILHTSAAPAVLLLALNLVVLWLRRDQFERLRAILA